MIVFKYWTTNPIRLWFLQEGHKQEEHYDSFGFLSEVPFQNMAHRRKSQEEQDEFDELKRKCFEFGKAKKDKL